MWPSFLTNQKPIDCSTVFRCPVCSGTSFNQSKVLWQALVEQWRIAPEEEVYIDRQQGYRCDACGANLRSMNLAAALLEHFAFKGDLRQFCIRSRESKKLALLEINEAGTLSTALSGFRHYRLTRYPEVDMRHLPFSDDSHDIVIHSDVLEHVDNPGAGLAECFRILKPNGVLIFTIPIIYGRLSRTRGEIEPPSYHGDPTTVGNDLRVYSEFGADFWVIMLKAGFCRIKLFSLTGPESIAILGRK